MKPPEFDYLRPATVQEAVQALVAAEGGGKIIAGGQSLMPMLNFRLLSPSVLIDINRIPELASLTEENGGLRIGSMTRHHTLETSEAVKRLFPVLHAAMAHVAHLAIRNRGTIGGSITHADPAAELPMMMLLLESEITIATPRGKRVVEAEQFFVGALTCTVEDDEIVTEIYLPPLPPDAGWAFEELARRSGDFALAAVGVIMTVEEGRITHSRVAVMGVGDIPLRLFDVETVLYDEACEGAVLQQAIDVARASVEPTSDLHASSEYRRHLLGVLVKRALQTAWRRAHERKSS